MRSATMGNMGNDELAAYLDALQREDCYRVDEVVKESPYEVTQRVSFVGANGAQRGPFIRKFIKREAGLGSVYERLFEAQQEGRRFKHLPDVLECYPHDDELVVVMEYARGETLQELVYQSDPSVELARQAFPPLCDAASELHEDFDPPIIHRDLKPSNVIMSQGGCTIIDFGIAREYKDGVAEDTTRFGTRAFAPPEQFGFGQTTVRSDVYALGMLLYFCLTETIPAAHDRTSWYEDQRIPISLRGVIAKATAFDPMQRYASASELKAAFMRALDEPVSADAVGNGAGSPHIPGSAAQSAQPEANASHPTAHPSQPAMPPVQVTAPADALEQSGPPHVIGRIWNVIVVAAFLGLSAFAVYRTVNIVAFESSALDVAPWQVVVKVVLAVLFLALLAFACLDKRRIRSRLGAFANVRAWQLWLAVLIAYVLVAGFNLVF